jgi:hypothetical protein
MNFKFCRKSEQICPYGAKKKCTYGNKCKFYHPERGLQPHKSVTERLSDFANYHLQVRNQDVNNKKQQVQGKSLSVPINVNSPNSTQTSPINNMENYQRHHQTLCRTTSNIPNKQQQQQQQQQQQHMVPSNLHPPCRLPIPGQALSASTSPTNNILPPHLQHHHQQFSKSQSIDSLPHEMYHQPTMGGYIWNQKQQNQSQGQQQQQQQDEEINLHKKLQRQLSLLNPFDPRLYQMQRYQQQQQQQQHFQQTSPGHKSLSNSHSLSGGSHQQSLQQFEHQVRCQ